MSRFVAAKLPWYVLESPTTATTATESTLQINRDLSPFGISQIHVCEPLDLNHSELVSASHY